MNARAAFTVPGDTPAASTATRPTVVERALAARRSALVLILGPMSITNGTLLGEFMARYWVFTIGLYNSAPPPEWIIEWQHHRDEMWFPDKKRPVGVSVGDRALLYGSQARGFIGAVEVVSREPEENRNKEWRGRFPWKLRYRLLVAKVAEGKVASPRTAGINVRKIQRGPHTQITRQEFERGIDALVEAARAVALA